MDETAESRPASEGREPPFVSVIIPVHNAQAYLAQCLDSVLGQELRELEVIAIDDASSDGSAATLAAVGSRDRRVRVITFEGNRGVSAARNAGLAAATGDFVAFVDADDYVDATMYSDLLAATRTFRADVVSCGIEAVDQSGGHVNATAFPLQPDMRHDPHLMRDALYRAFRTKMLWFPVRSLYRRALLAQHDIRFDERVRKGEDSLFNLQALHHADGVACIRGTPYHYRQHAGSATARTLASESENIANMAKAVLAFYSAHGFDERARRDYYGHLLSSDLPTALARLRSRTNMPAEARALTELSAVRDAFEVVPLRRLHVPGRVMALLILVRLRAVRMLVLALRIHGMASEVLRQIKPHRVLARAGHLLDATGQTGWC